MDKMERTNKNQQSITYNIREERLKASEEKKKSVDEVMDNAKKHFEEIFNRG
jgi:lipopolysaccharide export system protein LptA